jgi:hypothetical protein
MLTLLAFALAIAPSDTLPRGPAPYWQQRVAYDITARLEEPLGVLRGTERILYVNNSPDTLRTFAFHLHLNAFRPGSRWSDADSIEGRRRFNDLKEPDYASNHVSNVRIMGQAVTAIYPLAPDSTIVRFQLPAPLAPGDSMVVETDWDARLSTVPRRQGRKGRHYDFAQWYPKVVVFDQYGWEEHPLVPAGEFYGEFGNFRVQVDVPEDQVLGATGVPVCGDPGWSGANQDKARAVEYGAEAYPGIAQQVSGPGPGRNGACAFAGFPATELTAGYKRVLWYAESVHHFALTMAPDYRYEGGRFRQTLVHVLYQPGDEKSWGGVAVKRTEIALDWLGQLFGPFVWPQITNVHRIEGGGTEFPMMIMDGSASQGLIVHELGHNYTMGILANNEWREGWLDEGFTSFQSSWFSEVVEKNRDTYSGNEAGVLQLDLGGWSEPVSLISDKYSDFVVYNQMIYSKGELFLQELRYVVGDSVMHEILQTWYQRWQLKHVDGSKFQAVAEEVSGMDLGTLFGQWLHSTPMFDYAVGKVQRRQQGDGWVTRVQVLRKGDGMIPVDVAVIGETDTAIARTDGISPKAWVEVTTRSEPKEVLIDPTVRTHDWNMLNNRYRFTLLGKRSPPVTNYFDTWFSEPESRDRLERGFMPAAWYNTAGGLVVGARARQNYLGMFEENQLLLSYNLGGPGDDASVKEFDYFLRLKNPVWLRAPSQSQRLEVFRTEGRWGGLLGWDWSRRDHLIFGPTRSAGVSLRLVDVDNTAFLDPQQYIDVGIAELMTDWGIRNRVGRWQLGGKLSLGGGLVFNRDGLAAVQPDLDQFYFRGEIEGTARREIAKQLTFAGRLYGGVAVGAHSAAKQRQIYLSSSDPFQQLYNPFLRSEGSLLVLDDVPYQAPGGAGVRAADFRISGPALIAANIEFERTMLVRQKSKLFSRVSLAAFGDAAQGIRGPDQPATGEALGFVADAGLGLRASHRIGKTSFLTRFDFPFYLSEPAYSRNDYAQDDAFAFRWLFSVQAAF